MIPLGSHDLFLAEVAGVTVEDRYMDENGKFRLSDAGLVAYSHGEYYELGEKVGSFGYSVRKKPGRTSGKKRRQPEDERTVTLYYAEDDTAIAEAVREYLDGRGCRVTVFAEAESLKRALQIRRPDVVILDWNLPQGSVKDRETRYAGGSVPGGKSFRCSF